jgi:predicted GTPase
MEQIVNSVPADVVVIASPIDLRHLLDIQKPAVRVVYDLVEEPGSPTIADALKKVL